MVIGLTGGVGAGKSTVAALLAGHGAVVIDADRIAREVVEPGTPGLAVVLARFGPSIVAPDGSLDRAALAAVVFGEKQARDDLNAIVHPLIGARAAELAMAAPEGSVVVHDIPLLAEGGRGNRFAAVVVVEAPLELRLARLAARGMPEAEARSRMAAQATDEQRRAIADEVIVNDGDREQLAAAVDALWPTLQRLARDAGGLEGARPIG